MNSLSERFRTGDRELDTTNSSDEELLAEYRRVGERRYFDELVRRYEHEIFNYLRRFLGSVEAAEDVFQTTFLLVHLKADQFQAVRRFRPWLYAIATNAAIDARRTMKRQQAASLDRVAGDYDEVRLANVLVSEVPDPLDEAERFEESEWVRQAMGRLSDPLRSAVTLVYFQGLKYREAGEVLNVPEGTIKSRVFTAIHQMASFWRDSHRDPAEGNQAIGPSSHG